MFRVVHSDQSLTLECGTPTDLKIRVQMVNCRSLAERGWGGGWQVCEVVPEGVDSKATGYVASDS